MSNKNNNNKDWKKSLLENYHLPKDNQRNKNTKELLTESQRNKILKDKEQ